jgi:peptidylprolyl isomerase
LGFESLPRSFVLQKLITFAVVLVLAVAVAACGEDEEPSGGSGAAPAETPPPPEETAAPADVDALVGDIPKNLEKKPRVPALEGEPPAELVAEDIVKGKGPAAKAGDQLRMQYVGVSWSTSEQFDASWDRGQPFEFQLGAGMVIPGWDQGLEGMRRGGRRLLVIPPDMGYGPQGQPPVIGPNETLVFVVDLERIVGSR